MMNKKDKKNKKKDKERVDKDIRPYPNPFFRNYDYAADPDEPGPGPGLYQGKMDKYKSTKDFIEKSRKRRRKQRLAALQFLTTFLKESGV